MTQIRKSIQLIALSVVITSLSPKLRADASIQLAEFDVTNAVSSRSAPIPLIGVAAGVISSPLIPVGVNFGGTSSPGLYWDSSWTTSPTPNSISQRIFFNLFAGPGATVAFDSLDFFAYSGGSPSMGVELRVFGAGGSTITSPQYLAIGSFNSPAGFATHVVADVSSLAPLQNGDAYQFSLSFFNRNPASRIGLSGDRSDIGILGGNVVLTGDVSVVPELSSALVWSCLIVGVVTLRQSRKYWR
jgi:hypothetical protein